MARPWLQTQPLLCLPSLLAALGPCLLLPKPSPWLCLSAHLHKHQQLSKHGDVSWLMVFTLFPLVHALKSWEELQWGSSKDLLQWQRYVPLCVIPAPSALQTLPIRMPSATALCSSATARSGRGGLTYLQWAAEGSAPRCPQWGHPLVKLPAQATTLLPAPEAGTCLMSPQLLPQRYPALPAPDLVWTARQPPAHAQETGRPMQLLSLLIEDAHVRGSHVCKLESYNSVHKPCRHSSTSPGSAHPSAQRWLLLSHPPAHSACPPVHKIPHPSLLQMCI